VTADDLDPWDAGVQNERTALAWQRTGVNGSALAGAALLAAAHRDSVPLLATAAVVVVGCCALIAVLCVTRDGEPAVGTWRRLLAVAGLPILLAALGITLALTP